MNSRSVFADEMNSSEPPPGEISDETLVADAVAGNRDALETLVKRHQDYVYNVSLKLFLDPEDALDATQEVLIKIVTRLETFAGKSNFRTWAYRIAVNHFLNSPQRKMEKMFARDFDLTALPAQDAAAMDEPSAAEIEEVRLLCSTAMLMCLDREQRLIYIVGEVFAADHRLGAELFGVTPANYRAKLSRARRDLLSYVRKKCGLIDPANDCRCHKKTRVMTTHGLVDRENLRFNRNFQQKVGEVARRRQDEIGSRIEIELAELFRDSPFQIRDELDRMFAEIIRSTVEN